MVEIFIVGSAKCGTSALHDFLDTNSQIAMSRNKEPNFFSYEQVKNLYYITKNVGSEGEYKSLWPRSEGNQLKGESSVSYASYLEAIEKLHTYNPHAKLIFCYRDPLERSISHYMMDRNACYQTIDFNEIWSNRNRYTYFFFQYFSQSKFEKLYENITAYYPKSQVLLFNQAELRENSVNFRNRLSQFLEVDNEWGEMKSINVRRRPSLFLKILQRHTGVKLFLIRRGIKYNLLKLLLTRKDVKSPVVTDVTKEEIMSYFKETHNWIQACQKTY